MKKRIWSLLFALAMVTSLVPAAMAAEDDPKDLSQETLRNIATVDTSSASTCYWEIPQGNYKLTSNVTLDNTIDGATYISLRFGEGNSTLDLNGHSITSSNMAVITNQGTLTIKDGGADGKITGTRGIDNYGTLTINQGTVTGTPTAGGTSYGVHMRSEYASFTMNGGKLDGEKGAIGFDNGYTNITINLVGGTVGDVILRGGSSKNENTLTIG